MQKEKLITEIDRILFQVDPIGINYETNTDEYDAEAYNIAVKLKGTESVEEIAKIVREEFIKSFDMDLAGGKYSKYDEVAEKISRLFKKNQEEKDSR